MQFPVTDLHCDLLSYLTLPNSGINRTDDIGCALPFLRAGNVKLQVMAIYAPTETDSHSSGIQQSLLFSKLAQEERGFYRFTDRYLKNFPAEENVGMIAAIENGSAFCDENIALKDGFRNLENIINHVGTVLYIGLTHHAENRFGGGNFSEAGLKKDGEAMLDYLHNRKIAVDFSHTSDALAYDILNYIAKQNLKIPIIASHSNYRKVYSHPRNLPDEIALEIIRQKGLIGLNFIRAFVHPDDPEFMEKHTAHALQLGGADAVCYGADYFYTKSHPDPSRIPFYFPEHEDASRFPEINTRLHESFGPVQAQKISCGNAVDFITRIWRRT